jgi:hypothetical protein
VTGHDSENDADQGNDTRSLSDYIQSAAALESVANDDGSTTIYLHVHRRERYSTLPRLQRQSWLTRIFGGRAAPSKDLDRLGTAANVRKIPRRRSDLL